MKSRIFVSLFAAFLFPAYGAMAQDIGMVMDASGDAKIIRKGTGSPADLGAGIQFGDSFQLAAKARLSLVTYIDCNEWILNGPGLFRINDSQALEGENEKLKPARKMPVCYEPDVISAEATNSMGAFVLRGGAKDPVGDFREDFEKGRASASALMTLVMHDLQNGKKESARMYYEALKKHSPDCSFVKKLEGVFTE